MTQTVIVDNKTLQEILKKLDKLSRDVAEIKQNSKLQDMPMVDEETEKHIAESLKDIKEGRYIIVDPSNEDEMNKLVGLK